MKIFVSICGLSLVATVIFFFSGFYNIGADNRHWPVTEELIAQVRDASISKAALDISVPDELDNAERIRRGAGNYAAMCATCHLTPGQESSEMFAGLYPQPPRFYLDEVIEEKRAFWVVKHGLKMTGMPAWGGSNTDDDIWSLVAFLRAMPEIEPDHYRTLVAKSDGHTHGKEKAAQMSHDNGDGHHDAEATKKMDDHNSDGHSH